MTVSAETPSAAAQALAGYSGIAGRHDECMDASGRLRPHWEDFFQRLGADPAASLRTAEAACRRTVAELEVSMNVYEGSLAGTRAWPIDPLPLLLQPQEWSGIEAGLRQRAHLLNRLLQDIYGPRQLLRDGTIPAGLIMANPRFQRPCAGLGGARSRPLHTYAADLARAPDGRWWVLDDRLDAPSGLGYILQNRLVVRQALGEVFDRAPAHRLYWFFKDMRASLRAAAPSGSDPLVVLLTPGAANETYQEHAFLARYLGCPLVEGADLTTRDEQVFLRTIGGLRRVDVIVRRVDSEFCDPLQLYEDSVLGVPGLVDAARAGRVAIVNQLGCGALECPGLMAFLDPLCRKILGEDLKMPSAATWWCGQEAARGHVLERLEELVIKPAFRGPGAPATRYGPRLSADERAALAAEVRACPEDYCGQERVLLGTAPSWVDEAIRPRPFTLRVFLSWADGEYRVMPSGLALFNPDGADSLVSLQSGAAAKDTWVMADRPVQERPVRSPGLISSAPQGAYAIPSRLADDLFWLGRYIERGSQLARTLGNLDSLSLDEISMLDPEVAEDVARLTVTSQGAAPAADVSFEKLRDQAKRVALDPSAPASLAAVLQHIVRLIAQMKSRLPRDAWRIARQLRAGDDRGAMLDATTVRDRLAALELLTVETLPRDSGWQFLEMGRRLERSQQIVMLSLALLAGSELGEFRLQTLLHFVDSLFVYRSARPGDFSAAGVLDWLIRAEENPRGLRFQAERINKHLRSLPVEPCPPVVASLRLGSFHLLSTIALATPPELASSPAQALAFMSEVGGLLNSIGEQLTQTYFAHAAVSHRASD